MRNNTRARAIFVAVVGAVIAMGTPTQAEAQGAVINGKVTSEFGANYGDENRASTGVVSHVAPSERTGFTCYCGANKHAMRVGRITVKHEGRATSDPVGRGVLRPAWHFVNSPGVCS